MTGEKIKEYLRFLKVRKTSYSALNTIENSLDCAKRDREQNEYFQNATKMSFEKQKEFLEFLEIKTPLLFVWPWFEDSCIIDLVEREKQQNAEIAELTKDPTDTQLKILEYFFNELGLKKVKNLKDLLAYFFAEKFKLQNVDDWSGCMKNSSEKNKFITYLGRRGLNISHDTFDKYLKRF